MTASPDRGGLDEHGRGADQAAIRRVVATIEPVGDLEAEHRAEVLAWIDPAADQRPDHGFDPHLPRFVAKAVARL